MSVGGRVAELLASEKDICHPLIIISSASEMID